MLLRKKTFESSLFLNPAFCGAILYNAILNYNLKNANYFPYPLVYIVLALVLDERICNSIDSRSHFLVWINRNQKFLLDFCQRAKNLVSITNECLEFLLSCNLIEFTSDGRILHKNDKSFLTEDNVFLSKSIQLGKMLSFAGNVENIYLALGVRP